MASDEIFKGVGPFPVLNPDGSLPVVVVEPQPYNAGLQALAWGVELKPEDVLVEHNSVPMPWHLALAMIEQEDKSVG